ncbi:hypothetical protein PO909_012988 [Leuciscus waleckii]
MQHSQDRTIMTVREVFSRDQGGTGGLSQGGSDRARVLAEGQGGAGGMEQTGSGGSGILAEGQAGAGGTDQGDSSRGPGWCREFNPLGSGLFLGPLRCSDMP